MSAARETIASNIEERLRKALAVAQHDVVNERFGRAEERLRRVAREAGDLGLADIAVSAGTIAERLLAYDVAWAGMAHAPPPPGVPALPDWDGTPLTGRRLVFAKRYRALGADLRMGRLLGLAAAAGARVEAVVDPRLRTLFARSFPSVDFVDEIGPGSGMAAGYEVLGRHLTPDTDAIRENFLPLRAAPARTRALRRRYASGAPRGTCLVGLSWHSSNQAKNAPTVKDFSALRASGRTRFVDVNYGDRAQDMAALRGAGLDIAEGGIDQIASLDDLAAQLCALDHFVTISNSAAHMAGALGVQTTLLLADFVGTPWPVTGEPSPWYPNLVIERRAPNETWTGTTARIASRLVHAPRRSWRHQARERLDLWRRTR